MQLVSVYTVGIVENVKVDTLDNLGRIYLYNGVFGTRYYWWKHTRNVWSQASYGKDVDDKVQWGNGDIVKMRVDCKNWTLQYFLNDKKVVDPIPIQENKTYYAVVTNGDTRCEYHHILPSDFVISV